MSCSKCYGVDVFPLLKNKGCATPGPTGPAGATGATGPAGSGFDKNYLSITNSEIIALTSTESALPFNTQVSNNGWSFTAGSDQTEFVVPVTGTYRVGVNVGANVLGTVAFATDASFRITAFIYADGILIGTRSYSATGIRSDITSPGYQTPIYIDLIGELPAGTILEFRALGVSTNLSGDPVTSAIINSATIERIE